MAESKNPTAQDDNQVKQQLVSPGVSSIAQSEESAWRVFVKSSVFWVICFEVFLIAVFGLLSEGFVFFNVNNILTVALNSSQMIILAVGVTFVVTAGDFDLSVGTNLILSSTIAARVLKAVAGTPAQIANGEYPNLALGITAAVVVAIFVGMLGGLLNGLLVTKLNLPPFIATLASMYIFWGTALVISNGAQEVGLPRQLQLGFGHKKLLGVVPYPLILALLIGVIFFLIMKYTRFGLYTKALGSNRESARRAGIGVDKYRIIIYMIVGAMTAIAGFIDLSRFATTNPQGHQTDGLMAVMAVVMGGTSMAGGIASVNGTILASLIPVTLQMGMIVLKISSFYQMIATGVFLVIAVYMDQKRNANRGR